LADERYRLDRVLGTAGAAPPSVALEIVSILAERSLKKGCLGKEGLRARALELTPEGRVRLPEPMPGASPAEDAAALGALLFELVAGSPWPTDPARRKTQLDETRRILIMWPGGAEFSAFLSEVLLGENPWTVEQLRDRSAVLRNRVGGGTLRVWVETSVDDPYRTPVDDFDNPDSVTGSFPAGALANAAARPNPDREPIVPASLKKTPIPSTPKRAVNGGAAIIPTWALALATTVLLLVAAALLVFLTR